MSTAILPPAGEVHAAPGFSEAQFEAFLESRGEPAWISQRRRAAFEVYRQKLAEPLNPEEFKRVDLRAFQPARFAVSSAAAAPAQFETLLEKRADFAGAVSHIDGRSVVARLDDKLARQGVLFGSLCELLKTKREILEPHLMSRAVRPEADRISAWHAAFWTGGTVLFVPRNVTVAAPLYSLIGLSSAGVADFSHTLVILEEGASATLLEETGSAGSENTGLHVGRSEER